MMRNGSLPTRFLQLVDCDNRTPVKIALFGKEASGTYSEGDVVRITEAYPYNKGHSLSTRKQAKVEFLPKDHINVDVSNIPSSTDPDFSLDVDSTEDFEVMAVQSVYCYQCCDKQACRNKKNVTEGKCHKCYKVPDQDQYYGSAIVILKRKDKFSQVRLFMDNLKKLFTIDDISDSKKLLAELKTQVPITARGRFTNTAVEVLSIKRSSDA